MYINLLSYHYFLNTKMLRNGISIVVVFSLYHLVSTQLSYTYPTKAQNLNPVSSFLSVISTNMKDLATCTNHPLVQKFMSKFLKEIQNNPECNLVFNLANYPGIEAGHALQQTLFLNLQNRGCQKADIIARHSFEVALDTFDAIDSTQYKTAFGRACAKYLMNNGYLNLGNASKLGKTLAEDIGEATLRLNPVDTYGYAQVLINAGESFVNRLGLKLIDFAGESIDLCIKELKCMKKGICV